MRSIDNGMYYAWAHSHEAVEYFTDLILTEYPGTPVNLGEEMEDLEIVAHHQYVDEDGLFTEMLVAEYVCDGGHIHVGAFLCGEQLPADLRSREDALKWFALALEADPAHPKYAQYKEDNEFLNAIQDILPGVDLGVIVDKMIEERS